LTTGSQTKTKPSELGHGNFSPPLNTWSSGPEGQRKPGGAIPPRTKPTPELSEIEERKVTRCSSTGDLELSDSTQEEKLSYLISTVATTHPRGDDFNPRAVSQHNYIITSSPSTRRMDALSLGRSDWDPFEDPPPPVKALPIPLSPRVPPRESSLRKPVTGSQPSSSMGFDPRGAALSATSSKGYLQSGSRFSSLFSPPVHERGQNLEVWGMGKNTE
jgi:hypothetical protein